MLTGSLDRLAMPDSLLVWSFFGTSKREVPKLRQWRPVWTNAVVLERRGVPPFLG